MVRPTSIAGCSRGGQLGAAGGGSGGQHSGQGTPAPRASLTRRADIVDIKPANMEELTEVITAAEFHPLHCNLFVYSSSKGSLRLCDMRAAALCDKHSKRERRARGRSRVGRGRVGSSSAGVAC